MIQTITSSVYNVGNKRKSSLRLSKENAPTKKKTTKDNVLTFHLGKQSVKVFWCLVWNSLPVHLKANRRAQRKSLKMEYKISQKHIPAVFYDDEPQKKKKWY